MGEDMETAEIGLIGLGVMGSNLALNIAEKGHRIAVFNRTTAKTAAFADSAGALRGNLVPCETIEELAAAIRAPRPVIIMVQAGAAVDEQIALLRRVLAAGDIIIDAGNANFRDTVRRFNDLQDSGLAFIGMGVSGGEEGARHGPSIMVGGPEEAYGRIEPVLTAISAKYEGEPCSAWLGTGGAGHFVKTIHNGIEYGDMQMIAEIYGILRDGLGMEAKEIGQVFDRWNQGRLNSYLIEITATVLAARRHRDWCADRGCHSRPGRAKRDGEMVCHRSTDARRPGNSHRSSRSRTCAFCDEERAGGSRDHVRKESHWPVCR